MERMRIQALVERNINHAAPELVAQPCLTDLSDALKTSRERDPIFCALQARRFTPRQLACYARAFAGVIHGYLPLTHLLSARLARADRSADLYPAQLELLRIIVDETGTALEEGHFRLYNRLRGYLDACASPGEPDDARRLVRMQAIVESYNEQYARLLNDESIDAFTLYVATIIEAEVHYADWAALMLDNMVMVMGIEAGDACLRHLEIHAKDAEIHGQHLIRAANECIANGVGYDRYRSAEFVDLTIHMHSRLFHALTA